MGRKVVNVHLALDEFDTLLDVGFGLNLVLLDEYWSDELVDLVVLGKLGKLL